MRNLIALPDDPTYLDLYVAIRDKKHKTTRKNLTAVHALIEERYLAYAEAIDKSSLASIKSHAPALLVGDTLRACYDGATQPLRKLKQAIKDAQPKRLLKYCPMCGTTLPGTFDHYMPAVKFPEFAVHPLNLVPCCAKCNSTKDADWLSVAGKRQFLHTYTDPVPDLQFVNVTFQEIPGFKGVGANFSLIRPIGVVDEFWNLISSHFQRLKLIDRYDELGNDEVAEILQDCRIHLDSGGQDIREFLRGRAKDRCDVYGRNHWIAVLMDSMARHVNLDNWVRVA
ncbi:hypothetical protein [Pseudomonas lurida]|uniref:hypothetical protein n=1 Tax=Pseudomonas lurida TaxID=244566 RepID=UPI001F316344|nr:hypothetical protein [Pseudomonas lurida]MCF5022319.1 hypothetical protein [Pseudomonas lurida]MCF5307642.1 hypothetical protein [Pseudomonas lurida]MCF5327472.1 hypothetical protein [Pseudomonas lurida]